MTRTHFRVSQNTSEFLLHTYLLHEHSSTTQFGALDLIKFLQNLKKAFFGKLYWFPNEWITDLARNYDVICHDDVIKILLLVQESWRFTDTWYNDIFLKWALVISLDLLTPSQEELYSTIERGTSEPTWDYSHYFDTPKLSIEVFILSNVWVLPTSWYWFCEVLHIIMTNLIFLVRGNRGTLKKKILQKTWSILSCQFFGPGN